MAAMCGEIEELKNQLESAASATAEVSADSLIAQAVQVNGVSVIITDVPGANPNILRQLIDQVRRKASPSAVLLASAQGDKAMLVAGLTRDLVDRGADAGQWLKETAPIVGGAGGGKPDLAQAGGKDGSKLPQALEKAREVIGRMLATK